MIFPFPLAYAETHYRFKYFFSLYKKREPEVIADGPHRLDPDSPYPVMVLIKDAHLYPIDLTSVTVRLRHQAREVYTHTVRHSPSLSLIDHYRHFLIDIPFEGTLASLFGHFTVDVEVKYLLRGKERTVRNNNHRFTSKTPLKFYRSHTGLPALPGWIYGDPHTHSTYTEDQVEFGAPISAGPHLCRAMGLSFFAVTDHSYDLDDRTDSYLLNDPSLPKWNAFQQEVDRVNRREKDFAVLRGEEVSCTNRAGNNVHFLLLGNRTFFHGSGDSGEKWFRTKSEHTIRTILTEKELSVIAVAAHPTEEVPYLQRLLLKRDEWSVADMSEDGLTGVQVLNGEWTDGTTRGLEIWQWMLLKGLRSFLFAGNDAHGNYNRFVQISIPMLSFREKETQVFGRMKSAVLAGSATEESILDAMREGRVIATTGPLVTVALEGDPHGTAMIGETLRSRRFVVKVIGRSTEEFGRFSSIRVIVGTVGEKERTLFEWKQFSEPYHVHRISEWHEVVNFSYIRIVATTINGRGMDRDGTCLTNPIWIHPE